MNWKLSQNKPMMKAYAEACEGGYKFKVTWPVGIPAPSLTVKIGRREVYYYKGADMRACQLAAAQWLSEQVAA